MPKYRIPSFEVDTDEELEESYDGEVWTAYLPNEWKLCIPSWVTPERLPEPLAPLMDGFYYISGVPGLHKRISEEIDGKAVWMVWSENGWRSSPFIYYGTEDSMRSHLNYEGGF
jgi:hypothetical protein